MKQIGCFVVALGCCFILVACGPSGRPDLTGGDDEVTVDAPPYVCTPVAEICDNLMDDDCDGRFDCLDPDCSGVGTCPVCGMVQHPEGQPLALPDGEGSSYTTKVTFTDFGPTQVVTGASNFVSVCVKMEHSWLRDLQIDLISPSGQMIALQTFLGQTGSEVFMGTPVDDDDIAPVPGTGADYCWTPTSLRPPMLTYANQSFLHDLPAGNYSPAQPFSNLVGAMLNGDWTLKVTDLWAIDNGYIFEWSIAFDPTIVQDCSTPPIQ